MTSFRAGTQTDIENATTAPGDWLFIDIGFRQHPGKSCGFLEGFGTNTPQPLTFADLCDEVTKRAVSGTDPLFLVIEAPLSRAFFKRCPIGRVGELLNGKTRYWYANLGTAVMTAAGHLLREFAFGDLSGQAPSIKREIVLFEGFVSFKTQKTTHQQDVLALRQAVLGGSVQPPQAMKGGQIVSVSSLFGLPTFAPPLIVWVNQNHLAAVQMLLSGSQTRVSTSKTGTKQMTGEVKRSKLV